MSDRSRPSPRTFARSPASFFQRATVPRAGLVLGALLLAGYSVRALVVKMTVDDYREAEKRREKALHEAMASIASQAQPRLDYDRIWRAVLSEERLIEEEEAAAAAAAAAAASAAAVTAAGASGGLAQLR